MNGKKLKTLAYYQEKATRKCPDGYIPKVLTRSLHSAYAKENGVCDSCGSEEMPTADHVIPAHLLKDFGLDPDHTFNMEWLQTLCYPCNRAKGGRLDFTNWRTKPLLLRLLNGIS